MVELFHVACAICNISAKRVDLFPGPTAAVFQLKFPLLSRSTHAYSRRASPFHPFLSPLLPPRTRSSSLDHLSATLSCFIRDMNNRVFDHNRGHHIFTHDGFHESPRQSDVHLHHDSAQRRFRPALNITLPSVSSSFFTPQQASSLFPPQAEQEGYHHQGSNHEPHPHIFFPPTLNLTPYKLTPQHFTFANDSRSSSYRPIMEKPYVSFEEADFTSLSSVERAMTLSKKDFTDLRSLVCEFIDDNEDFYTGDSRRRRLWSDAVWNRMTRNFVEGDQRGPQMFTTTRDGFKHATHLSWATDSDE